MMVTRMERLYFLIPLLGAIVWCGGLLAMLITWEAQGRPRYISEDGTIPFISDIAADILKPLFITVCVITSVSFALGLVVERRLRHFGRLPRNLRSREKLSSSFAIFGAILGGLALILLSIFDTKNHHKAHRVFLLIFMVGFSLSAIFTVIEFRWLNKNYAHTPQLRRSYVTKAIIVTVLIALAIAFGATLDTNYNVAAILEWVIAFGFTFYLLTLVYDLRMTGPWDEAASVQNEYQEMVVQGIG